MYRPKEEDHREDPELLFICQMLDKLEEIRLMLAQEFKEEVGDSTPEELLHQAEILPLYSKEFEKYQYVITDLVERYELEYLEEPETTQ